MVRSRLAFLTFASGVLGVLLSGCSSTQQGQGSSGLLGGLGATSQGGLGGDLANIQSMMQTFNGANNAKQSVQMQTQTLLNSLNQLKSQIYFVRSPQQGAQLYSAINNAISQVSGQPLTTTMFSTGTPSVNVVAEQISLFQTMLTQNLANMSTMNTQQLLAYNQRLQAANTAITSASAVGAGSMMYGGYGGGYYGGGYGYGNQPTTFRGMIGQAVAGGAYNALSRI